MRVLDLLQNCQRMRAVAEVGPLRQGQPTVSVPLALLSHAAREGLEIGGHCSVELSALNTGADVARDTVIAAIQVTTCTSVATLRLSRYGAVDGGAPADVVLRAVNPRQVLPAGPMMFRLADAVDPAEWQPLPAAVAAHLAGCVGVDGQVVVLPKSLSARVAPASAELPACIRLRQACPSPGSSHAIWRVTLPVAALPPQQLPSLSTAPAESSDARASMRAESLPVDFWREWVVKAQAAAPGFESVVSAMVLGPIAEAWGFPGAGSRASGTAGTGCCVVGAHNSGRTHVLEAVARSIPALLQPHVRIVRIRWHELLHAAVGASERALDAQLALLRLQPDASATGGAHAGGARGWPCFSLVILDDCEELLPSPSSRTLSSPLLKRLSDRLCEAMQASCAERVLPFEPAVGAELSRPARVCWLAAASDTAVVRPDAMSLLCLGGTVMQLPLLEASARLRVLRSILLPVPTSGTPLSARDDVLLTALRSSADRAHGFTAGDLVALAQTAIATSADIDETVAADAAARLSRALMAALDAMRPALVRSRRIVASVPPPADEIGLQRLVGVEGPVTVCLDALAEGLRVQRRAARLRMGAYPPKGLLITGPRGSGKSSLALALARHVIDSGLGNALVAGSTDIISPVLGASEAALAALFQQARSLAPCVLVIDQVHLLASASAERFGHFSSPFARLTVALGSEFDSLEEPAGPPPDTVDFDKPSSASEAVDADSELSDVDCALSRACSAVFVIGVAPESSLVAPSMLRHGRLQTVVALPDMTQPQLYRLLCFYFSQSPLSGEPEAIPPNDVAAAASPPARASCVPEGALQSLHRICPCAAAAAGRSAADSPVSAPEALPPDWHLYLRSLSSHLSGCPSFGSRGSLWTAASTRRLWETAALGALRRQCADPVAGAATTAERCCINFADVEAAMLDTKAANP